MGDGFGGYGQSLSAANTTTKMRSEEELFAIASEIAKEAREKSKQTKQKLDSEKLYGDRKNIVDPREIESYKNYRKRVETQINQLKVVLKAVEAKEKERMWLKQQNFGEID